MSSDSDITIEVTEETPINLEIGDDTPVSLDIVEDSPISIDIVESSPLEINIVEDTPVQVDLVATGPEGPTGPPGATTADGVSFDPTYAIAQTGGFFTVADDDVQVFNDKLIDGFVFLSTISNTAYALAAVAVQSVTGDGVDNSDPLNPIITAPDPFSLIDTDTTHIADFFTGPDATYRSETMTGGSGSSGSDRVHLSRYQMPAAGKLLSMKVNLKLSTADTMGIRGLVYSDVASAPDALLASSADISITNTSYAYSEVTYSGADQIEFAEGDYLWLGFQNENVAASLNWGTEGSLAGGVLNSNNVSFAGAPPDPYPGGGFTNTGVIELTLTYATAEQGVEVVSQMSITDDASGIKLVNDEASPGNDQVYGTDGSGVKGWINAPSTSTNLEFQDYDNAGAYVYVGYEDTVDASWSIYRRTVATNAREYASGGSSYATNWTSRVGLTYI